MHSLKSPQIILHITELDKQSRNLLVRRLVPDDLR
jgi:hypothetical protein